MKHLLMSILALTIIACNQDKAQVENLEKEVFAVHDEVMPKMSKLLELKEAISQDIAKSDSLLKFKPNPDLEKRKTEGLTISEALEDADRNMMDWMHTYNSDSLKTLQPAAAIDYLKAEKTKIVSVRDKMLDAMVRAEKFTGSNP
jgi:hypothetical protein